MMKSWIEMHKTSDGTNESTNEPYAYVIDGQRVSPFFSSRTVCEAFRSRYEGLSERLVSAKARLAEHEKNDCKRGIIFYGQYYIPKIEEEISRFFQDVRNGVFEMKVLKSTTN